MNDYTLPQSSKWTLPPTVRQVSALLSMGVQNEDIPDTRWRARDLIYRIRKEREVKNNEMP